MLAAFPATVLFGNSFPGWVVSLSAIVLCLGALAGHLTLLSVSLNIWHGYPLPRAFLSWTRKLHTLAVVAGPLAFLFVYRFDLEAPWNPESATGWQALASAYLVLCAVVGLGVLPAVTLYRVLRRLPGEVLGNHTRTVDIAARLGYKPTGHGKYRRIAALPGNEVFQVDFTEKTFVLPRVPVEWDGLTILHLTDLHFCGTPDREFYEQAMDLCREWTPDLVAITGDIVDSPRHHRWVLPLLGRLSWQVAAFAILGNHDAWHEPGHVRRRLKRLGMHVLGNGWEQIEVRGHPLVVIGHEGPWFLPAPDLSNCPVGPFRLCLSHTPDNFNWARQQGIDLVLAGHVHGGQIRLPVIGSILVPSRYSRRFDCGVFHQPPTLMHVGRGLGGQHPVRFNCRPEVTKIVLRTAAPE